MTDISISVKAIARLQRKIDREKDTIAVPDTGLETPKAYLGRQVRDLLWGPETKSSRESSG